MPNDIDATLRNGTRTMDPPSRPQRNEIVVYQPDETLRLDVRLENEMVWLNRHQMARLFGRDVKTIGKHIANALTEELSETVPAPGSRSSIAADNATTRNGDEPATVAKFETVQAIRCPVVSKFATTATDGKTYQVEYYNLDVVLSVGYRVKSSQGILFRRWANAVLRDYLLRGHAVNERLVRIEDRMDRRFAEHGRRLVALEDKVDFFVRTQTPPLQGVFYDGQLWDARAPLSRISAGSASRSRSWMRAKSVASRKQRSRRGPASGQAAVDAAGQTLPAAVTCAARLLSLRGVPEFRSPGDPSRPPKLPNSRERKQRTACGGVRAGRMTPDDAKRRRAPPRSGHAGPERTRRRIRGRSSRPGGPAGCF